MGVRLMQFCQDHWDALRKAIDDRGLSGLVAKSGEAAAESMARQIEGTDTPSDFDPLMWAHWAISGQYLKDVGLSGMAGDKCPLCEVEKSRTGLADNWIDGSTENALMHARALGLVPGEQ